eukprot:EG_transcript_59444
MLTNEVPAIIIHSRYHRACRHLCALTVANSKWHVQRNDGAMRMTHCLQAVGRARRSPLRPVRLLLGEEHPLGVGVQLRGEGGAVGPPGRVVGGEHLEHL